MGTRSNNQIKMPIFRATVATPDEFEDNPGEDSLLDRAHEIFPEIRRDNGDLILRDSRAEINEMIVGALEREQRDYPTKLVGLISGWKTTTKGNFLGKLLFNKFTDNAAAFVIPTTIVPKGQSMERGAEILDVGPVLIVKDFSTLASIGNRDEVNKRRIRKLEKSISMMDKLANKNPKEVFLVSTMKKQMELLKSKRGTLFDIARNEEEAVNLAMAYELCHVRIFNSYNNKEIEKDRKTWQDKMTERLKVKKDEFEKLNSELLNLLKPVTVYGMRNPEDMLCDMYALARYRPEMLDKEHHDALELIFKIRIQPA